MSKYIAPILQQIIDKNHIITYYEPFCGGLNMMDKIICQTRIGNDSHKELIEMWKALQNGWQPPEYISEEDYLQVKNNRENYPPHYVGYVGFHATFGAKYFGGYGRNFKADGTPRCQSREAHKNTMKQIPKILDVELRSGDYRDYEIQDALIYCDPPYSGATGYSTAAFDYDEFWDWCRKMSNDNIVIVSEYNAPDDFKCIWSKENLANFDARRGKDNTTKKRIEKLFVYEPKAGGKDDLESILL